MGRVSRRVLESLEKWSAVIFLLAGILLLIGAIVIGLQLLTGDPSFLKDPFELAPPLGFVISYLGLLGLYPRLADPSPRLAKVSVGLLLLPVLVLLIYVITTPLGVTIPYGGTIATVSFVLFALGIALFGIGSYQTPVLSSPIGLSLLAISATWFVVVGEGLLNGFPVTQSVLFGTIVIQTGALLAIGYLLRTESEPPSRSGPASDTAVR